MNVLVVLFISTGIAALASKIMSREYHLPAADPLFLLILPSNIKAAMEHNDMYKANYQGTGTAYLWFRIPLQLFFIAWIYFSTIKNSTKKAKLIQ